MTRGDHRPCDARVVVLGHSGFLGAEILLRLRQADVNAEGISSAQCDLLDMEQVAEYFSGVTGRFQVVFCAARTRQRGQSFDSMTQNIRMIQNFLHAVPRQQLDSVVYLSSVDVYGSHPKLPISENSPSRPHNSYGISKLCGEYLLALPGLESCPAAILRLPGVYGSGDQALSVVGRLFQQMCRDGRVKIVGDGRVRRDFLEVGDLCSVVRRVLEQPFTGTLNIVTGQSITVIELVHMLSAATRLSPAIEFVDADSQQVGDLIFDATAMRSRFPDLQLMPVQHGIAKYISTSTLMEDMDRHG
ncbi:MAG: hypothetical protein CMH81_07965 [Nitrospiraceae bacterium]|nr:hypothetical protein [Nitrospiraceae bacterium]|tara:strand:+ start:153 stop:1058 length:906 start_codon:yes stop_codon:yes gene_type:complete